jgi:hypothetical protein
VAERWRDFYGAHPLHLLGLLACFALAGYAVLLVAGDPLAARMLVWFLAAVIGHDLVLFPLYAAADSVATRVFAPWLRRSRPRPAVPVLNHLRFPALAAALLFALFFPGIVEQGAGTFHAATGLTQQPYLARWLLLTAALFAVSAIVYAARLLRARRAGRRVS